MWQLKNNVNAKLIHLGGFKNKVHFHKQNIIYFLGEIWAWHFLEIHLHILYSCCIILPAEFRCFLGKTRRETFQTSDYLNINRLLSPQLQFEILELPCDEQRQELCNAWAESNYSISVWSLHFWVRAVRQIISQCRQLRSP